MTIRNFTGLEAAKNLRTLVCKESFIADISPLTKLTKLTKDDFKQVKWLVIA